MKKFELIKHAYDNYPKGTKFIGATGHNPIAHESTGDLRFSTDFFGIINYPNGKGIIYDGTIDKWAEIVNPKIAVKVENEKESVALEKHFKEKGWRFGSRQFPLVKFYDETANGYSGIPIHKAIRNAEEAGYQIIPFGEFAEEKGIKLPLITTLDGHDLFDGDYYIVVSKNKENWQIFTCSAIIKGYAKVISEPDNFKAFHDKQNALSWIEAQKPKTKIIDLNHEFSLVANCSKESVSIQYREGIGNPIVFTKEMIYSIVDTLKELE